MRDEVARQDGQSRGVRCLCCFWFGDEGRKKEKEKKSVFGDGEENLALSKVESSTERLLFIDADDSY